MLQIIRGRVTWHESVVCQLIRDSLQRGQLTGTNRFIDDVEGIVGLRIEQRGQGRPRVEHDK
jgi:putative transposase